MNSSPKILIIGASGFVGSNLLNKFESMNEPIRVLTRNPNRIHGQTKNTFIIKGDLEDKKSLKASVLGIETIYYLSHGMGEESSDFELVVATTTVLIFFDKAILLRRISIKVNPPIF